MKYDVCLVSCGKQKLPGTHKARDLYIGDMTRKQFCYAEATCKRWFILSAKYGLLEPDQLIASYQLRIEDIDAAAIEQWAGNISRQLVRFGISQESIITAFSPKAYIDPLLRKGWRIDEPLRHMIIHKRKKFFASHGCRSPHYRMGES